MPQQLTTTKTKAAQIIRNAIAIQPVPAFPELRLCLLGYSIDKFYVGLVQKTGHVILNQWIEKGKDIELELEGQMVGEIRVWFDKKLGVFEGHKFHGIDVAYLGDPST